MADHQYLLNSAFTTELMSLLSAQPLYELCREQIHDVCNLIGQCCLRVGDDRNDFALSSLCIKTAMHEEAIFQYASTDTRARLAHWVRQYSECETASDLDAHAAYIMACAVKALGALNDWMRTTGQNAWSHLSEAPTDWPR